MLQTIIAAALQAGQAIMRVYDSPESDWQVERKADNSPLTLADRESHRLIAQALDNTGIPLLSEEGAHLPYSERRNWQSLWIVDPLDGTKEFIKRNGEFTVNIALVCHQQPALGVILAPATSRLWWGDTESGAFTTQVPAGFLTAHALPLTDHAAEALAHTLLADSGARRLPLPEAMDGRPYSIVASRSHLSPETAAFASHLQTAHPGAQIVSAGSSLKICLVAEGHADIYPRLAPTMEWDTAAGDAIARAAGCKVIDADSGNPLTYNKEDLHNPSFIVHRGLANIPTYQPTA